jgi:hypothetical protein
MKMTNTKKSDRDILEKQYQSAEQNARHADTLIWSVTSITWSANLVLLGLILRVDKGGEQSALTGWPAIAVPLLGILLTTFVWKVARINNWVMNEHYATCLEIEDALEMKRKPHHAMNDRYPKGLQKWLYALVSEAILFIWSFLLFTSLVRREPSCVSLAVSSLFLLNVVCLGVVFAWRTPPETPKHVCLENKAKPVSSANSDPRGTSA